MKDQKYQIIWNKTIFNLIDTYFAAPVHSFATFSELHIVAEAEAAAAQHSFIIQFPLVIYIYIYISLLVNIT